MTDEARVASVRHPDRMMRAIEHQPEPVGRIADTVPIELHARVERLLLGGQRSDEAGEFGDVGIVGAANLDGHREVIARTGACGTLLRAEPNP